jgi:fructuronate reductase
VSDAAPRVPIARLDPGTLAAVAPGVTRPAYDRGAQRAGLVHLGVGAFHRAHQAAYTDAAMNGGDRDWMTVGVSLRGEDVPQQLNPQRGLYTLTERSADGEATRVVGSLQCVLHGPSERAAIVATLAAATTRIVTFTVTEKGYCRAADGSLDRDLAHPGSLYGLLGDALDARRRSGLPGLTLLSCDNLAANGTQLARLMAEALDRREPALRAWFEQECACPSSMVDRIVPATTDADRDALATRIGVRDEAAVFAEPFTQWVIEDRFAGPRPSWESVGARLTTDVHAYETAKLRMLNGAHSALAYLGLERGHTFVHEAAVDAALAPRIERLMRIEAATSLTPARDQDLDRYADALLARFRNPALKHRLAQIAMDGSQKIPQRWLETLQFHRAHGRACPSILAALAAWLRHVRGDAHAVDDPLAARLAALWRDVGAAGIVDAVFTTGGPLVTAWRPTAEESRALTAMLATSAALA